VIGIIALGLHRGVGFTLGYKAVIYTHQDNGGKAQVISQLQRHVCYRGAFPYPPAHVNGEFGRGIGGVEVGDILCHA